MAQRIYLIEDDTALRNELAHLLELAGFTVGACTAHFADAAAQV